MYFYLKAHFHAVVQEQQILALPGPLVGIYSPSTHMWQAHKLEASLPVMLRGPAAASACTLELWIQKLGKGECV